MTGIAPEPPDHAIARLLAGGLPDRNRVSVDLAEFRTNRVVVDFDDCDRVPAIGDLVDAVDLIDHREATAEVVSVNTHEHTAALVINWDTVREATA